jgi:hypothetical protein
MDTNQLEHYIVSESKKHQDSVRLKGLVLLYRVFLGYAFADAMIVGIVIGLFAEGTFVASGTMPPFLLVSALTLLAVLAALLAFFLRFLVATYRVVASLLPPSATADTPSNMEPVSVRSEERLKAEA